MLLEKPRGHPGHAAGMLQGWHLAHPPQSPELTNLPVLLALGTGPGAEADPGPEADSSGAAALAVLLDDVDGRWLHGQRCVDLDNLAGAGSKGTVSHPREGQHCPPNPTRIFMGTVTSIPAPSPGSPPLIARGN